MKTNTPEEIVAYRQLIGQQVEKISRKPFKSGQKVNTVSGLWTNQHTGRVGFSFLEDDSIVECWKCKKT